MFQNDSTQQAQSGCAFVHRPIVMLHYQNTSRSCLITSIGKTASRGGWPARGRQNTPHLRESNHYHYYVVWIAVSIAYPSSQFYLWLV
jgi:cytochrome oxidase assembly protein ShyY1